MARSEPTRIGRLLPAALAQVAQRSGSARGLSPVWEEVVGERIARQARPISLTGNQLRIEVSTSHWATELAGQERELRDRMNDRLGSNVVGKLVFEVAKESSSP